MSVEGPLATKFHAVFGEMVKKENGVRAHHPSMALTLERGALLRARNQSTSAPTTPRPSAGSTMYRQTAAVRFLEEKTHLDRFDERANTPEALFRGVSHDGNGRKDYLFRRSKYNWQERYGHPMTSSQFYGSSHVRGEVNYVGATSKHLRKPIIMSSFFRGRGIDEIHKNVPGGGEDDDRKLGRLR